MFVAKAWAEGVTTLSMNTFTIMTLSKKAYFATLRITTVDVNDTKHNNNLPLC